MCPRCSDGAGWSALGRDKELQQLDVHTLPRCLRKPGLDSEALGPFEKVASRPLVVTQTDPLGGEETRAFGGSRGPNSVTHSLRSFSAVNPTLWGWGRMPVPHPYQLGSHCPSPHVLLWGVGKGRGREPWKAMRGPSPAFREP